MRKERLARKREGILRVVIELLESEGYDGLKVKDVAEGARTSLATIYKLYTNREQLIVAALTQWMEENTYSTLDGPAPNTVHAGLRWIHEKFFEPWKRNPRVLEAYHRALASPGGNSLTLQGMEAVEPLSWRYLEHLEPSHGGDVAVILGHLIMSLMGRVAHGELTIDDLLDVVDRAVVRLVDDSTVTLEHHTQMMNRGRVLRSLARPPRPEQG